jgi:hypothetical protein
MIIRCLAVALASATLLVGACNRTGSTVNAQNETAPAKTIALSITSTNGKHDFQVETAKTSDEQERGLMFRTDIPKDGGMLFWPYPGDGGPPREASFWMKNTPSPLDIIFIRPDGTIAKIAENAVPFDETPLVSGEPVGAVLELNGGRTADLGITAGDTVRWAGQAK